MTLPEVVEYSSRRVRALATFCLCMAFLCCGLMLCMLGPTLLDLGAQTGSTISQMGYVFTIRSCLYLIGSLIGGEMIDKIKNPYFIISASFALVALTSFVVPLCKTIYLLAFVISAQGLCMGLLDTGGNVLVLRYWGADCGPWMQSLHFCFGVGAFLAPLIAEPFLAYEESSDDVPLLNLQNSLEVKWAYYIIGYFALPLSAVFLAWGLKPVTVKPREEEEIPELAHRRSGRFRNVVVGLAFVFFFLYVGLEVGFGNYLFTYAVEYPKLLLTKSNSALLTSVFWGAFAAGRLLSIPLAVRLSPIKMLTFDLVGSMIAAIIMITNEANETALWATTAFLGISIASVFPTGIHLIETYIDVTGRVASMFVVGAALGEMAIPLAYSQSLETEPRSFLYITVISLALACLTFLVLYVYAKARKAKTDEYLRGEKQALLSEEKVVRESEA